MLFASFLHVLQLVLNTSTGQRQRKRNKLCCIRKSLTKQSKKPGRTVIKLWLSEVHVWWLFDWIHEFFQIVLIVEYGVLNRSWIHNPISSKSVSLWLFDPHQTTHQWNTIGCAIKKSNRITSSNLKVCGCYSVVIFMFSIFWWPYVRDETCVASANVWRSIHIIRVDNRTSFDLVMVIGSVCAFVLWMNS